jgi:hypothetical protein
MMGSDKPALTNLDAYEWQGMQAQACDAGGFANRCPILFYLATISKAAAAVRVLMEKIHHTRLGHTLEL